MQNDNTFTNETDKKLIIKHFIYSLVSMIIFGGIVYYFLFALLSAMAWGADNDRFAYLSFIIVGLVLVTIFTFIIRKFKKTCGYNKTGKGLFIFLIIFAILSPFIAGFTIHTISSINSNILSNKLNKGDQCDQDLYGSIVKVIDIKDSHKVGDPFILLELDIVAKKEAILSFENYAGVSYQGKNFSTQLFRARLQRDVPWNENFRFTDKADTYYQTTIPEGESKLFITLDSAVSGLQVDGPYRVDLRYRLLSEESTCLWNELGYSGRGYHPSLSLIPGGYQTQAYSWQDFLKK